MAVYWSYYSRFMRSRSSLCCWVMRSRSSECWISNSFSRSLSRLAWFLSIWRRSFSNSLIRFLRLSTSLSFLKDLRDSDPFFGESRYVAAVDDESVEGTGGMISTFFALINLSSSSFFLVGLAGSGNGSFLLSSGVFGTSANS